MLLSTKGRYAVMAIVEVARQNDARPLALSDISLRLDLSLAYLEQLFMKLRRKGIVQSVRGPGGGYILARNADAISIGEVMAAVDEPVRMTRCEPEDKAGCVASKRCSTHNLWLALGTHIERFLADATVADVLTGRFSGAEVVAFPGEEALRIVSKAEA
ncbi:transcriptional regulator, BadM/Rrf2 family [Rhodomicrobium vannielii ATCC 17100]|jgi:Rrf2 family transcriptional regulator, iron-sulfur cluster assembly transcription factor|uniref:Transcriptional regulator, BadM/Rrf2 family n=1 Tax=Rhodomicrobium vannielii (strain ATCC 17100 / DSM 162 / LMG 4299 / NCIMB 10020 / ATH 3.1.1) TaxID=648757 RepID=E3HZ32_RHOVT|nr:Rrf2 family transcriptional regulator [Rhodomicrobium vannielii]ADP72079.1 transcriptional regulator, BadM/Rrf2 family [Rhodomicrobium vannielii ATCC 17100]